MKPLFSDYIAGAAVATDLVNTAARVRGAGDAIADVSALREFLAVHELHTAEPGPADLAAVHVLRDQLRTIMESGEDEAARSGGDLLAGTGATPVLERDVTGSWQWYLASPPGAGLAAELAALTASGLLSVLRTLSHDRFRHCAAPRCDGMFVDTSRAGRRRFCMPEICGNRLNVARYRARRDTAEDGRS